MSNSNIFISYRRVDSEYEAGFIYDRLAKKFGHDSVFLDVDKIPPGTDFAEYLDHQLSQCQVFLAVIGAQWIDVVDEKGNQRLKNKNDYVRVEIESALKRDIPVIPLLLNGARIPTRKKLPKSMRDLARRHAIQIRSGSDFNRDMERLILRIEPHVKATRITKASLITQLFGWINSKRTVVLPENFSEDLGNNSVLEMVSIPGGNFRMGSPEWKDYLIHEGPQRRVTIETFFMGKYPVTQSQYVQVMGTNPIPGPKYYERNADFIAPNKPVVMVSWRDATQFCERLTARTGRFYHLPSEAEWEYACRAGTTTPYHFGQSISSRWANFGHELERTTEVGRFQPNNFGLFDMHGNVEEWCADHWHHDYSGAPSGGNPWIEGGDSNLRVLRGGAWPTAFDFCTSSTRAWAEPDTIKGYIGFRVVCSSA